MYAVSRMTNIPKNLSVFHRAPVLSSHHAFHRSPRSSDSQVASADERVARIFGGNERAGKNLRDEWCILSLLGFPLRVAVFLCLLAWRLWFVVSPSVEWHDFSYFPALKFISKYPRAPAVTRIWITMQFETTRRQLGLTNTPKNFFVFPLFFPSSLRRFRAWEWECNGRRCQKKEKVFWRNVWRSALRENYTAIEKIAENLTEKEKKWAKRINVWNSRIKNSLVISFWFYVH